MKFFTQTWFIAGIEAQFFRRFPRLLLAALVVTAIPALYTLIYLSSVWDPAANSGALPVALVNLDQGVEYREHVFNAGWDVAAALREKHVFGFQDFADEALARQQVREGKMAFALIIPKDFSSNAIPGQEAGAGKLVVYTSEGNNFEGAMIARQFARELGHDVNENLNERRWKLVLSSAAGSQRNVDRLHEGVDRLRAGATELSTAAKQAVSGARSVATGSDKLSTGVGQLTAGFKQLSSGLKSLDAKRAPNADLVRLKSGADALAAGHIELGKGMSELQSGGHSLHEAVSGFQEEAHSSLLVPDKIGDGLDQLSGSLAKLDAGLQAATEAQLKLQDGANKVSAGVSTLTSGMRAINAGVHSAVTKLPDDSQLDDLDAGASTLASGATSLADGNQRVKAGADRLGAGLDLLATSLPARVEKFDGSPQGLANSVKPVVEIEAPVLNSGSGFAANVIPAALWLGAGVAAFLIHIRVLPRHARYFSHPAQAIGKILIPALLVLLQSVLVWLSVTTILKMQIAHPVAFALSLFLSSLTFLAIVFALTRAFGDAGKALAMIFLAVQLSSSGGILPVELSGSLFAHISPWLPLTWVVRALKATMFGAFELQWGYPLLVVGLTGGMALLSACYIGRWRFVKHTQVRPAVDF
jgi:putative membrane protein